MKRDSAGILSVFLFAYIIFFLSAYLNALSDLKFFLSFSFLGILFLLAQEFLFRGMLQPRIGLFPSALLSAFVMPALYADAPLSYLAAFGYTFLSSLIFGHIREKHGLEFDIGTACMLLLIAVLVSHSLFFSVLGGPVVFILAPFYYFFYKGKDARFAAREIGLRGEKIAANVGYGIAGFFFLIAIAIIVILALGAVGIRDSVNVEKKLLEMPESVLLIAVFLAPFAEEVFFRGFLLRKFGIFSSTIVFALAHILYGSIVEVCAAFLMGLFLCALSIYRKNLIPAIVSHTLFNLTSVIVLKFW